VPYNKIMSKYTHLTGVVTYDIRINEQQRALLHKALQVLLEEEDLGGDPQMDEDTYDEVLSLTDMLDPTGSTGPLAQDGINSFVL